MVRAVVLVALLLPSSLYLAVPGAETDVAPAARPAITGTVVDSSGAAVPGAEVTLTDRTGRRVVVTTDAAGRFDIGTTAAGPFTIAVLVPGFEPAVAAAVTPSTPVTVTLTPAAV